MTAVAAAASRITQAPMGASGVRAGRLTTTAMAATASDKAAQTIQTVT